MELSIDLTNPGVLIATVCGEVDIAVAGSLREHLCEAVREPGCRLVVDLTGVSFIDSTGLNALIATRKKVQEHDGIIRLVVTAPPQLRVFEITGLDTVFSIYATLEDALAADRGDMESV
jgi:anti-anti-sigma factor